MISLVPRTARRPTRQVPTSETPQTGAILVRREVTSIPPVDSVARGRGGDGHLGPSPRDVSIRTPNQELAMIRR
jgi:hypothetical protein